MGKKDEFRPHGKSKMTVVMFHTEGDDDTLREGFRTMGLAMTAFAKPTHAPVLRREAPPALPAEAVDASSLNSDEPELDLGDHLDTATVRPSKVRTYRSPQIIKDLDLTSGASALKTFLESKAVGDNDSKRQLAMALWLKENRGINEIGADHIYTCYRHMGWNPGKDVTGILRSLKKAGCFSKGSKTGMFAINHIGEGRILASNS